MRHAYTHVRHDAGVDAVAVEEPLEIRVDGESDAGLTPDFAVNTIDVTGPLERDPGARRFYTTSSCGVCGKGALEEVAVSSAPLPDGPRVPRSLVAQLPSALEQPAFERTGGLHATGLFDDHGRLLLTREDVGRHNSMDKVIGRALLDGMIPLGERILCVSGRLSFELMQKAAVAGAPILVGVGAPSSLAVSLADERGTTLCGFARGERVNVYTHPQRIIDG